MYMNLGGGLNRPRPSETILPRRSVPRHHRRSSGEEFLQHLLRHLRGKLLVIWDGLPAHRSRVVKDFLMQQRKIGRAVRENL